MTATETRLQSDILLATYNGAAFLGDLLDSLVAQDSDAWQILICDDGSVDETRNIIREWAKRLKQRAAVFEEEPRRSAKDNFERLLLASRSPYFFFCDQDDVWLPTKLSRMIGCIRRIEGEVGADTPILVQSDLIVCDNKLETISESYWKYQRINPWGARVRASLFYQNVTVGCATVGNEALRKLALPFPPEAIMHDWWLALLAAHAGRLEFVSTPSVLYRQHSANLIGSHKPSTFRSAVWSALESGGGSLKRSRDAVGATIRQASALAGRLAGVIPEEKLRRCTEYASLRAQNPVKRRLEAIRLGVLPQKTISKMAFLLAL